MGLLGKMAVCDWIRELQFKLVVCPEWKSQPLITPKFQATEAVVQAWIPCSQNSGA